MNDSRKKSKNAWLSIGEVATILELPPHVLRFWESKFNILKPLKRVSGRRYYRTQDVDFLRGLKILLHENGYTIKGAQNFIRTHGIEAVRGGYIQSSTPQGEGNIDMPSIRNALAAARDALDEARIILRNGGDDLAR